MKVGAVEISSETKNARRGLTIYFTVLILGSIFLEWKIIQTGESIEKTPWLILALMYTPAVASIVARLALRDGFEDVSFHFGAREGVRMIVLAWVYPMVVGLVAYGTAWATGLAAFQPPLPAQSHLYSSSAETNLMTSLIVTATLGTIVGSLSAFVEELCWRGYILTRLIIARVPMPIFVSGLVWALWHVPLILSGQYAAGSRPSLSAMLFVMGVVA